MIPRIPGHCTSCKRDKREDVHMVVESCKYGCEYMAATCGDCQMRQIFSSSWRRKKRRHERACVGKADEARA